MPSYLPIPFSTRPSKHGFTLIEVVLVVVITLIISAISLPYFAGAYKGTKLRSAARTITRMAHYARGTAIMREKTVYLVLNHETMDVYLGTKDKPKNNGADGELDQDVLKRLGYTDGKVSQESLGIEKEIHHLLPEGLTVRNFDKEWTDEDDSYQDFHVVHYYPNGQSDWFELELEDKRGTSVKLENDPVSGKVTSEFMQ